MSDTPESTPDAEPAAKPAFKVTRSPFAPKISGTVTAAPSGPMSIGAGDTLAAAVARVPTGPRMMMSSAPQSEDTSIVMFVVDLLAAGVSVAAAVLMALKYF